MPRRCRRRIALGRAPASRDRLIERIISGRPTRCCTHRRRLPCATGSAQRVSVLRDERGRITGSEVHMRSASPRLEPPVSVRGYPARRGCRERIPAGPSASGGGHPRAEVGRRCSALRRRALGSNVGRHRGWERRVIFPDGGERLRRQGRDRRGARSPHPGGERRRIRRRAAKRRKRVSLACAACAGGRGGGRRRDRGRTGKKSL